MKPASGIFLLAALAFAFGPAVAEDFADALKRARASFEDCALGSVAAQLKQDRGRDLNLISERSFSACVSEERYVRGMMLSQGISPELVEQVALTMRLQVKKLVRDIAANPSKYVGSK